MARTVKLKTPPYLRTRESELRVRLAELGVPALLITNPRDIRYLTGFSGDDSWALVTAVANAPVHILSDFRFQEEIVHVAPHAMMHIRKGPLVDDLKKVMDELKLRGIAAQQDYLTVGAHRTLQTKLAGRWITPVEDKLIVQRAVKSPLEVATIQKAIRLHQDALRNTVGWLRPGVTESQVAAYFEHQLRELGADGTSFPTIIAAGANASLPHAVPGQTRLREGQIVLIDCGGRFNGYCSDITRTYALASMPRKMQAIYKIVLDAQLAAIAAIRPGKKLKDIDAVARKRITKAGYGKQYGHGLGHGIGLDIHEEPRMGQHSEGELLPGHVVTVEPGIYLPGVGGVRIEDDVLVTRGGCEVLTDLPKGLDSAII